MKKYYLVIIALLTTMYLPVSAWSQPAIFVYGTVYFQNPNTRLHLALPYARIEFYDWAPLSAHEYLGFAYTNERGYFEQTVSPGEVGPDIYAKIILRDDFVVWVGTVEGDINSAYSLDGMIYRDYTGTTLNMGSTTISSGEIQTAALIFKTITFDGWEYLKTQVNYEINRNIGVLWSSINEEPTEYRQGSNTINFNKLNGREPDAILHELAHAVMRWRYEELLPDSREGECSWVDPDPAMPSCAWSEGWANFFAAAVQNDPLYVRSFLDTGTLTDTLEMPNRPSRGLYASGAVSAYLWDIYDGYNETCDGMSQDFNNHGTGIWHIFSIHKPATADEFHDAWIDDPTTREDASLFFLAYHHRFYYVPTPCANKYTYAPLVKRGSR